MSVHPFIKWVGGKSQLKEHVELGNFIKEISAKEAKIVASNSDRKKADADDVFFESRGVPAKAVGCSALRYRSFLQFVPERLWRCSIA